MELNGSNTNGGQARANVFFHYEPGPGSTVVRGAGLSYPARDNLVYDYSFENNLVLPTIEKGASFNYLADRGSQQYITNFTFGAVYSAGAFISETSYYGQEFAADTNSTSTSADSITIGDDGRWYYDNSGTTATSTSYQTPRDVGGYARLSASSTSGVGGLIGFGETQNVLNTIFAKANLPIVQMKIRANVVIATDDIVWGLMSQATSSTANDTLPTNGIFFWHNNSTSWVGFVKSGSSSSTVTCSGTISTSTFAAGRIEVLSTTSVRFLMDYDTSNGISYTDCGTATTSGATPTSSLGIAIYLVHTNATAGAKVDIDHVRVWQDDAPPGSNFSENSQPTVTVDQIPVAPFDAKRTLMDLVSNEPQLASSTDIQEFNTDRLITALEIISPRVLTQGLVVESISALDKEIIFKDDIVFFGRPYFNSDTAGFAVIKQGDRQVKIVFDRPYLEPPVINVTMESDGISDDDFGNIHYLINQKTDKDFVISLNKTAQSDIKFNWSALAVKNAKTFFSIISELLPQLVPETTTLNPVLPEENVSTTESVSSTTSEPAPEPTTESTSTIEGNTVIEEPPVLPPTEPI